jgi:alkanesulfonate monooxygenase SsuD/methylene tetrahydromethanopterin reductase-like flavin-dependent oxidoreductase (luciferase family)
LRLGSYVLAAPFHTAGEVAWHAASLDLLSGGRFELGLGAGRPGAEQDAARLGLPFGSPGQRVDQLAELVKGVKSALAGEMYPRPAAPLPIMIAGAGRRMLALAAAQADIVAFGMPPQATDDDLAGKAEQLRAAAGERAADIELALSLHGVGNEFPDWLTKSFGLDGPALIAAGAVSLLTGSPRAMADTLLRRRDRTGVSYVITNSMFLKPLAGVIELLDGQ